MSHISVLLHETVDALVADRNTGIFIDGTFGRGGHTRLLLSKLDENARVYGFDKDPQALETAAILEQEDLRFKIIHASFADLKHELEVRGIGVVDGVMADLGVSSPQLDQAERGFSFMKDGPLDMRMDNSKGPTAAQWLVNLEEEALANIIFQYGEERYSRRIAKAIKASEIIFIAVGTPPMADGSVNLDYVKSVAESIGKSMDGYKVIINKSTVPIGTGDIVKIIISQNYKGDFDVVSNPEFLKEGTAVSDFMNPDRIIVGSDSAKAESPAFCPMPGASPDGVCRCPPSSTGSPPQICCPGFPGCPHAQSHRR